MTIQIAIADEMDLALAGAQMVLSQRVDFQVISTCQRWHPLLMGLSNDAPDVLLLSDRLDPDCDAVTLVQRVRALVPTVHIILLSTQRSGPLIYQLLDNGLEGYLYRGDPLSEYLIDAIYAVRRGRLYLSPTANAEYLLAVQSGRAEWQPDTEARDVLRLLADGYRPQEIALKRGVSVRRILGRQQAAPTLWRCHQRAPHHAGDGGRFLGLTGVQNPGIRATLRSVGTGTPETPNTVPETRIPITAIRRAEVV